MSRITITADIDDGRISRHIYGHFAEHLGRCIYDGLWVGEDSPIANVRGIRTDIVEALKKIRIPNLRWPGGCFADDYHWTDGIGPRSQRPTLVNHHWGRVVEDNAFGTHEFMDLCEQLDTEPYICGNVGTGSVREMQQWVEYLTSPQGPMASLRADNGHPEPWKVRMWGVGNENWACGGYMRPEYYCDLFRNYVAFLRNLGDNRLYKIACGPYADDLHWTDVLMRETQPRKLMHAMGMHFYCGSGRDKQPATQFDEEDWYFLLRTALRMDELLTRQIAVMDRYDPDDRVGMLVDEWGTWHAVEAGTNEGFLYQQNTMRDAVAAAVTLDIFHKHSRRVHGANIAQTVNVLQAMVLTDGEAMILTPTYHVFEMYAPHHDAVHLPCHVRADTATCADIEIPSLSASATRADDGSVHLTITNLHCSRPQSVPVALHGCEGQRLEARVLHGDTLQAHNTFDAPETVTPRPFDGARRTATGLEVELPPASIVAVTIR
jgi:alpha-N-arabinofuranosidase